MTGASADRQSPKLTLGQAIDQVIAALDAFEEGDQQTVLRAVYAHLKISGPAVETSAPVTAPLLAAEEQPKPIRPIGASDDSFGGIDIKSFKELKNPTSARQMACVVAYYLAEIATGDEHKETVTTGDIEKYFKQGRYALPTKLEQLLIDCRAAGYFENQSRGEYKLTRVGHNLVAHQLPAKSKG
jgi:hypothetical protein